MRISPAARISIGLVLLTTCILLAGDVIGLTPGRQEALLDARKRFCETMAVNFALAAHRNDLEMVKAGLELIVDRNEDVLSAALRKADGRVIVQAGDHQLHWQGFSADRSTPTHAHVPIFQGEQRWGTVEVAFTPLTESGLAGLWASPLARLCCFVALMGFVTYFFFMKRTLRHLDPSAVIPARVKAALDVLAEGVVLLDEKERIVLANAAFAEKIGREAGSLMGKRVTDLGWFVPKTCERPDDYPWRRAMRQGEMETGTPLVHSCATGEVLTFMVNGAPIIDNGGRLRGALATFDDVTEMEKQNERLEKALVSLEKSRDEIRLQNQELEILATRDPLTGCLNRRRFFELYDSEWHAAHADGAPLACIMGDIDHFKSINDRYGHSVGDEVIQKVAEAIGSALRNVDLICRYGGEEFCCLLIGMGIREAAEVAERARLAVEAQSFTASFGVSATGFGATDPARLVDQADKALYESKRSGRNRVTRWDQTFEERRSRDGAPPPG
jgi:diguanylate cyclase (GGDEF)-like protein/PAS domain S-box-containing protein